jgi:hypothetical protein
MATNSGSRDEQAMWNQAKTGDGDVFGAIFDIHRDAVFRQAMRLIASVDDAEGITALVFLELG